MTPTQKSRLNFDSVLGGKLANMDRIRQQAICKPKSDPTSYEVVNRADKLKIHLKNATAAYGQYLQSKRDSEHGDISIWADMNTADVYLQQAIEKGTQVLRYSEKGFDLSLIHISEPTRPY